MSYKRLVLFNILKDIYPTTPIACGNTYDSIILYYTTEPLVPETAICEKYNNYTLAHNLTILRRERQQRLSITDIYVLPDFPHKSDEIKQSWLVYRQALRDITATNPMPATDDNDNLIGVVWPTPPGST